MSKKVVEGKLFVESFREAKIRCMKDQKKPTTQDKSGHALFHIGTNYLIAIENRNFSQNRYWIWLAH